MLELRVRRRLSRLELDLALEVGSGALALAGASGAGKTTTLRIAAGLERPDSGTVRCQGEVWFDSRSGIEVPPERRRVGYVFQDYALFPHLSALGNVAYGLAARPRADRERRARALLERFGIAHLARARPAELSGGERQRVALARALAPEPRALLLDEPLSALDPATRGAAARELRELLETASVPALVVTHDFLEAAALARRVAVIERGRLVQEGAPGELVAAPATAFVADFAGANLLHGRATPPPARGELTRVALDGGGLVASTDEASGRVGVAVFPWDVTVERPDAPAAGSQVNRLTGRVTTLTVLGNRARVSVATPQPVTAEVTTASVERLGLREGAAAAVAWKATATRLVPGA
ncbi:MAG: ABC transporter ATP-binding protein [Thermoleophilaceae bacterium]|nr:ABC transporter ATP-binding protein [Thermoleophilaceae bacterium]